MQQSNVVIYGDSLMKGTVIDDSFRYRATIASRLDKLEQRFGLSFINRARFGSTSNKGKSLLEHDIANGLQCTYALIEFGGNDCDFQWDAVSKEPSSQHQPNTPLACFEENIRGMIAELKAAGTTPVLMTLPPIHAERYLSFVTRNGSDKSKILQWLGDVHLIYRFHELYSDTVAKIARQGNILLADIRSRFLDKHNLNELIGADGIHLSHSGHALVLEAFEEFIEKTL